MASTHQLQFGSHLGGGNREAGTSSTHSCTLLDFDLNLSPAEQFDGDDCISEIPLNIVSATGESSVQGEQQAPLSDPRVLPYLQKGKGKMIDDGGASLLDLQGEKGSQSASCEPSLLMLPEVLTFSLGAENIQEGPAAVPNGVPFDNMVLQNLVEASNRANNRLQCLELFPLGNRNRNVVVDAEELPCQTLRLYHHQLEMAMFRQLDRNSSFAPRERKVMGSQNRRAIVSPSETGRLPESSCRVECSSNRNPSEFTPLGARNGGRKKDGKAKENARSRNGTALVKSVAHKNRRNV